MKDVPAPEIDTSRVPIGARTARGLVDAVVAGDDRVERYYLEVKGPLELRTKKDQAKLTKFILGAANRMPDKAAKAFDGYAVMVIGVSKGTFVGVPPIEMLDLERSIQPFVGADGPEWDVVRVPVPDSHNEVLLLIVDPPRWGQNPFVCRKDGDEKLRNGAIFVRADGETREAKGDELNELFRRGRIAAAPTVDFGVSVVGEVVRVAMSHEQALEDHLVAKRSELLGALPKPKPEQEVPTESRSQSGLDLANLPTTESTFVGLASTVAQQATLAARLGSQSENRTEPEYRGEIKSWEKTVRDAWPEVIDELIERTVEPIEIQLTNRAETYFHDVQLKVHLEGEVRAISCQLEEEVNPAPWGLSLPPPPRKWGPKPFSIGTGWNYFDKAPGDIPYRSMPSRIRWHSSGSVDIIMEVGELRPKETDTCADGDIALILSVASTQTRVRGTWEITARGHNRVFRGELSVPVVDRDLTGELRVLLGLDCDPKQADIE